MKKSLTFSKKAKKLNEIFKNFLDAYAFGPAIFGKEGGKIDIVLKISDHHILDSMINKNLRGLSPEVKINKWKCSICKNDYELCEHQYNEIYDGKKCMAQPSNIEFLATGIVNIPKDEKCRIEDLLMIYSRNGSKKYVWYGFKLNKIKNRFKHLQVAYDRKLIHAEALHFFAKHFSDNPIGTIIFES